MLTQWLTYLRGCEHGTLDGRMTRYWYDPAGGGDVTRGDRRDSERSGELRHRPLFSQLIPVTRLTREWHPRGRTISTACAGRALPGAENGRGDALHAFAVGDRIDLRDFAVANGEAHHGGWPSAYGDDHPGCPVHLRGV